MSPIPISISSSSPGLWDFTTTQLESRRQRYLRQQQAQQQLLEGIATLGQAIMKEQQGKKAKKEVEEAQKTGKKVTQTYDPTTGSWKYQIEEPEMDFKNILSVIAGLTSPEKVFPAEQLPQVTPLSLGQAEGDQVLTPPGATFREGQIFSPAGEAIGEYMPGYEPKAFPEAIGGLLGERYGFTPVEARRKVAGLPQEKITGITPTTAIGILADPMKSQQIKRLYPELYKKLEKIAKEAQGITKEIETNVMDINF